MVTGAAQTHMEICHGSVREKPDFRTTHEEADVIIVLQVIYLANPGKKRIHVMTQMYILCCFTTTI